MFWLGFYSVKLNVSTASPWEIVPQYLLSIRRGNKMNLIVSLHSVTISGLESDLKCTCKTFDKNVESLPWRLWAGRQCFPFITHLQRLHGKLEAHRRMNWHCIFFWAQTKCNLLNLFLIRSRHDKRPPWSSRIRPFISTHCVLKTASR